MRAAATSVPRHSPAAFQRRTIRVRRPQPIEEVARHERAAHRNPRGEEGHGRHQGFAGVKQQLDSVVALTGKTLNNAGVEASEDYVAKVLSDPAVRDKALESLQEEERALQERRQALQNILGEDKTAGGTPDPGSTRSATRKSKSSE